MTSLDVFTLCAFIGVLLLGFMVFTVMDLRKKRSHVRIATRMRDTFPQAVHSSKAKGQVDDALFADEKATNPVMAWLNPKLLRLKTVAGSNGIRLVLGAFVATLVLTVIAVQILPLAAILKPLFMVVLPVFAVMRTYNFLIERFRRRFLDAFPDAIDLIVRAVRAGVPVTHVLGMAADECPEPLAREFRIMGDSLKLGRDLKEVLDDAMGRICVADFSFFSVCLLLQRETGGQLGETLENLSAIVRTRREIRQKSKALTAEARITTKILAAIPIVIVLSMYFLNRSYVEILFGREEGQKLMTFAVISVVFGIALISRISRLDTSR